MGGSARFNGRREDSQSVTEPEFWNGVTLINCTQWQINYRDFLFSRHSKYMKSGAEEKFPPRCGPDCCPRTLRVRREMERHGCRWFVDPQGKYYACWNQEEERIVILEESEIIRNSWLGPNKDNPHLERLLPHLWETVQEDFEVKWVQAKSFKNTSKNSITVVYITRFGFESEDVSANGSIVDQATGARVWVREIKITWNAESSNPQVVGNNYVETLSLPQESKANSASEATFCLSTGASIAVWQPVVKIFGNVFFLDHTVFGRFETPQEPHFQPASVTYVAAHHEDEGLPRKQRSVPHFVMSRRESSKSSKSGRAM